MTQHRLPSQVSLNSSTIRHRATSAASPHPVGRCDNIWMSSVKPCAVQLVLPQSPNRSRPSTAHPFQVEDGSHLGKTGKLVTDSPCGDCGEIGYEGPQLLVELQTAEL